MPNWRGSTWPSGSDRRWRRVRAAHLAREPLCRLCWAGKRVAAAVTVDHIVPVAEAPHRKYDPDNHFVPDAMAQRPRPRGSASRRALEGARHQACRGIPIIPGTAEGSELLLLVAPNSRLNYSHDWANPPAPWLENGDSIVSRVWNITPA
jgi:hypothetical protein